tara:strand:+ start:967 stop:1254 length:288 start_codon:yes stop_codon:yes gene_type:complete
MTKVDTDLTLLKALDGSILKQAIRDVASKDTKKSDEALSYFISEDFTKLCDRLGIDSRAVQRSVKELKDYPIISRKKLSNDIARIIDVDLIGSSK